MPLGRIRETFGHELTEIARQGSVMDQMCRDGMEHLPALLAVFFPHLFVYGTLRSDIDTRADAPDMWQMGELVCRASVEGQLYLVHETYPGLVPGGTGKVAGEIWRLSDPAAALRRLDQYEGCCGHAPAGESEYHRSLGRVLADDGSVTDAWVYCWVRSVEGCPLIPGGDFARR